MAFGFPAYHTEEYTVADGDGDLYEAVLDTLHSLSWSITEEGEYTIRASTSINFWSWGERITVELLANDTLSVTSKCALPTQCFDWGKNRENVHKLLRALSKLN